MLVLDLFSGLGGWSDAFRDAGHMVVTLDNNPAFKPTICADVLSVSSDLLSVWGKFDVILASPPCECFSVASISSHWTGGKGAYIPKDSKTERAVKIVRYTLNLIEALNPRFWALENPRGVLRKVIGNPKCTITYCQYGERRMKPTDLWGELPDSFVPLRCYNGDSCHDSAPRGAKTGTQGIKGTSERAKIPYGLSLAFLLACEKDGAL